MKKILILCTGNSCRSQMAHAFLDFLSNNCLVYSAGTKPEPVNKYAVKVMSELEIDISNYSSNHIDEYLDHKIDLVVTVCDNAKEICPVFPKQTKFIHKSFNDPASAKGKEEEVLKIYREVRNQLEDFIKTDLIKLLS
ncbi:MAG: arsenate reductase ArsC [Flavobacteriales bacterium]